MNPSNELPAALSEQVRALASAEPSDTHVAEAQKRLEQQLEARTRATAPAATGRWVMAAVASSVAVVIVLLLPTAGQGIAFAEVQKHFVEFRTLAFAIDTRVRDQTIQQSRVYMNEDGDVRTDVGEDVSVVVSNSRQQVLTLAHRHRAATRMPLATATKSEDALSWLEELRAYQNAAKPLGTKTVDGKSLQGWELEIQGMRTQLWADESGLPVSMEMKQQALELQMHFEFDVPLAPELFSVSIPAGYSETTEG